ncbi:hypothetical protein CsatB_001647 [Cannabis sativa]
MVLPKHRFIGWQVVNNQLLTRDNLSRFLPISSPLCPVCCSENESHQHLFSHCRFTRRLVCEITKWCGHFDWPINFHRWFSEAANTLQKKIINTLILATIYSVWVNRNKCIFDLSCSIASSLNYVMMFIYPTEVSNVDELLSKSSNRFVADDDNDEIPDDTLAEYDDDEENIVVDSDSDSGDHFVVNDDDDLL